MGTAVQTGCFPITRLIMVCPRAHPISGDSQGCSFSTTYPKLYCFPHLHQDTRGIAETNKKELIILSDIPAEITSR